MKKENDNHTEILDSNMLLSKNIALSVNTRKTYLNDNICVIGGSGSGKTRNHVKPNLLQMYCNYVLVDPKGSVCEETGNAFINYDKNDAYDRKILNLVQMQKSMHYNPFKYFKQPNDVFKFVNNLVANTTKENASKGGDDFFENAEVAWMTAVIFFIMAIGREEERNFNYVMELLDLAEASEEDENAQSILDIMFEELDEANKRALKYGENVNRYSYSFLAVKQYNLYRKAAGKTAKSILISVGVRLAIFNLPELTELLKEDELELDCIGEPKVKDKNHPEDLSLDMSKEEWMKKNGKTQDEYESLPASMLRKTVLFIIISDSDSTFSFLSSILLQQLYELLYRQADERKDHRLPIHTKFMNDEFANCGKQPDFEIKIATMRSREISSTIILQNIAQLKNLYKDSWETIFGNCDTTIFLGGKEYESLEYLSKLIGNETVDYLSISETKGSNWSYQKSNQLIQRPLLAPDEIGRLDNNECLVHIRGQQIFRDKKFDVTCHKRVDLTTDASDRKKAKENFFDISIFLENIRQGKGEDEKNREKEFNGEAGTKKISVDRGRYMTFSQEMERIKVQEKTADSFMYEAG